MKFNPKDYYFKKAKKENFVARSVYKLEEIDKKFNIIKSADTVIDLGYYPGSWTQYLSKKLLHGKVVGIDIQLINKEISRLGNVELFEKDIFDLKDLESINLDTKVDVVLSDMAPKTTGIKSVDQLKSLELVEKTFDFSDKFLKKMEIS